MEKIIKRWYDMIRINSVSGHEVNLADYIAKELYLLAAGDQPVSIGSVTASVQRANDSLRTANSKGYDELCRAAGKPAGARLSNLELIRVLTEKIRRSGVVRPTCKG